MSEIKLVMRNRTNLELIFQYNSIKYEIAAGMSKTQIVEAGYQIWVDALKGSKAKKREVEGDLFVGELKNDIVIECRLVGWQLKLQRGTGI